MALTNIEQRIKGGEKSICTTCAHNKVCRYMDNQPCIECSQYAEQERHGRWIKLPGEWKEQGTGRPLTILQCSVCGTYYQNGPYRNCPHCRAIMDKEAEDHV